ncbi:MAG: hypothetical protein AMXMBFR64_07410 [Myxococcales bacterium]
MFLDPRAPGALWSAPLTGEGAMGHTTHDDDHGSHGAHDAHGHDDHGHDDHGGHGATLRQLAVIVVALLLAGAAWGAGRLLNDAPVVTSTAPPDAPAQPLVTPVLGAADPTVVILVASDFQCPFCARVLPSVLRAVKDFPDDVQLRYRFNPLSFHPQAIPAAKAALAAARQGRFWEMHDLLYARQKELAPALYPELAKQLGLDEARFVKDMADPAVEAKIAADVAAMTALGGQGTPNFFINGRQVKGAQSYDVFKRVIDDQVRAARKLIAAGSSRASAMVALSRKNHGTPDLFVKYGLLDEVPPGGGTLAQAPQGAPEAAADLPMAEETVYKVTVGPEDAQRGPADALVTVVVFSEFQCPFCARIGPTMTKLEETYGDKLRVVFKHNPLDFHPNARPAALAAMAAQEQGKFWEMHDKLFANQQKLERETLDELARDLGLDMVKFKAAMDTERFDARIDADMELADKVTVRGTPNSFVNGRKLAGAVPFEAFKKLVDEELAKAQKLVDDGTPRTDVYARIIADGKVVTALAEERKAIKTDGAPIQGVADAPIKIAVFSDFQCPYCSRVGPPLEEVRKHYGDKVAVVFKHFPLNFHDKAMIAAEAAEAAGAQGKFWEMHDKLFANQQKLDRESLESYAKELGLDMDKFKAALDQNTYEQRIKDSLAEGQAIGVRGTPSVYVDGRAFQPGTGYSLAAFRKAIDPLLPR